MDIKVSGSLFKFGGIKKNKPQLRLINKLF